MVKATNHKTNRRTVNKIENILLEKNRWVRRQKGSGGRKRNA